MLHLRVHGSRERETIFSADSTFRRSSSYYDELVWAAAWLHRATGDASYLADAEAKYEEFGINDIYSGLGWSDKTAGGQV
jgi:hypothetical protein